MYERQQSRQSVNLSEVLQLHVINRRISSEIRTKIVNPQYLFFIIGHFSRADRHVRPRSHINFIVPKSGASSSFRPFADHWTQYISRFSSDLVKSMHLVHHLTACSFLHTISLFSILNLYYVISTFSSSSLPPFAQL